MSRGKSGSPFTRALATKLEISIEKAAEIQKAFLETLRERVKAGGVTTFIGFGSFRMKLRKAGQFVEPPHWDEDAKMMLGSGERTIAKPAARRLTLLAKWEPLREVDLETGHIEGEPLP